MISLITLKSASQASNYYSKDNYYTQSNSIGGDGIGGGDGTTGASGGGEYAESVEKANWYGKGATALGLTDQENFNTDKFVDLLNGDIDENNQISKWVNDENGNKINKHRPGFDLTFSAPKSVSVLAEVFKNDEVRDAHEQAVKDTLNYIEDNYAKTRISVNGQMEKVSSGNLIVAMFEHNTSRDQDPQTHTHAVIINATINPKGTVTALSNEKIYQNQKLIGQIYNSSLAKNLTDLGYDLNFKPNGNFEIDGVDPAVIDEFSQRRKAMIKGAEERGIDIDSASASVRETLALNSRKRKSAITQDELDKDWTSRSVELGMTAEVAEAIRAKAQSKSKIAITQDNPISVNLTTGQDQGVENTVTTTKDQTISDSVLQDQIVTEQSNPNTNDLQPNNISLQQNNDHSPGQQPGQGMTPEEILLMKLQEENKKKAVNLDPEVNSETVNNNQAANQKPTNSIESDESTKSLWGKFISFFKRDRGGMSSSDKDLDDEGRENELAILNDALKGLPPSEQAVRKAVFFSIGHHTEREIMVDAKDVKETALKLARGKFNVVDVEKEIERLKKEGILIAKEGRLTTKSLVESEQRSIDHIIANRKAVQPILSLDEVQQQLDEKEGVIRQEKPNFAYTQGQKDSIYSVFTTDSRYHSINGLAGTGKTTMLYALKDLANKNGFIVRGMASTGVASKNLQEETGIESNTIDFFLYNEQKIQNQLFQNGENPERPNEIWVVDESSFTSQRKFEEILNASKVANTRVVFLGDKLQLQAIEAGKPFELGQSHMSLSEMTDINRQKTQELKDVVKVITAKDAKGNIALNKNSQAFDLLDQQGRVIQTEKDELHVSLVNEYMAKSEAERNDSLVITAFNADRKIINNLIRVKREQQGELTGEEYKIEVYDNKNLTKAEKGLDLNYSVGDVVRFNKTYTVGRGKDQYKFEKDKYYEVVSVGKNGVLSLKHKDEEKVKTWNPENKKEVEAYQKKELPLKKGDLVRLNRTNGNLKNGERFVFKGMQGDKVIISDEKGNEKILDKEDFKHWDHAYATTIYSSQGLTKKNVYMLINADKLNNNISANPTIIKNLGKIMGNRAFYVGVTRASEELKIYTHDKDIARGTVGIEQDKSSYAQETNYIGAKEQEQEHQNNKGFEIE